MLMSVTDRRRFLSHLSPASVLVLITGFGMTAIAFSERLHESWLGIAIGSTFTVLVALYLQLLSSYRIHAADVIAARTAELELTKKMLAQDHAARNFSEQALQIRDRAIALSANAISIYDATAPDFPLSYINPAFERMTGHRSADILGTPCCLLHEDQRVDTGTPALRALLSDGSSGNIVLQNRRKDGSVFWSEMHIAPIENTHGVISHFVAVQTDITALRSYQEQLLHRAHYDALTGLANRVLLRDRLEIALDFAARKRTPVWILFIGLERFKIINETMGHDVGDAVLKALAARVAACADVTDTVSRFGDNDFVLVLEAPQQEKSLMQVVTNIIASIGQPVTLSEEKFFVGCSVGIAAFPTDGRSVETLIKHADSAMRMAKSKGASNFHFYTPSMNQRAIERNRLETDLRVALEKEQFILYYQPQVDLRSGHIIGMEALIRWKHPERGRIAPADFIGLAEETGLIVPIGAWVIRTACAQMKTWQHLGFKGLRMSVNISSRQFAEERLATTIASVLRVTGLAPAHFQLELTESLVMADVERGIGMLRDLKALGVSLAVDDFGTGYSSLAYLKRLPIDTLKIDRSFVNDITSSPDDAIIVKSIISLAHNLRLRVVAEGVETPEQLAFLQVNGCNEIQGYHFSPPLPAADFTRLLEQDKALPPYVPTLHIASPRLVKV
jgi:diguanylate cyclase (GGDEF)-like protein/PAS domain S-box-containing protein